MSIAKLIRERLTAEDRFSLAEIRCWIADGGELELWAAVYDVLGPTAFCRITPEPEMEEACEFVTRYLLRCIHENVTSDNVPSGYDAAYDLAACLKLWASKLPETQIVLSDSAERIAEAYRRADERERDRLLNGTLEHALESASIRPYFRQWEHDQLLAQPWHLAMEWAVAHSEPATR